MYLGKRAALGLPHLGQLHEDRVGTQIAACLLHICGSGLRCVARGRRGLQ